MSWKKATKKARPSRMPSPGSLLPKQNIWKARACGVSLAWKFCSFVEKCSEIGLDVACESEISVGKAAKRGLGRSPAGGRSFFRPMPKQYGTARGLPPSQKRPAAAVFPPRPPGIGTGIFGVTGVSPAGQVLDSPSILPIRRNPRLSDKEGVILPPKPLKKCEITEKRSIPSCFSPEKRPFGVHFGVFCQISPIWTPFAAPIWSFWRQFADSPGDFPAKSPTVPAICAQLDRFQAD